MEDTTELVGALQDVLDRLNAGAGLRRLVGDLALLAERVAGADGAVVTTVEAEGGRVLVTTPRVGWLQGRWFPYAGSALEELLTSDERSCRVAARHAHPSVAADLVGHGIETLWLSRATTRSTALALVLLFRDPTATPAPDVRRVAELLASAGCAIVGGRVGGAAAESPGALPEAFPAEPTAAMADGLLVLDGEGTIRTWNPAAAQLTGLLAEAVVGGRAPFPLPSPGQVLDHRLDDGRWLELVCSPVGPGGETVVTFRDVTRPKLAEEAKDLVLATASHELRTPVTVVKGYAETLAGRWHDLTEEDRLAAVEVLRHRTTELAALVDRLLLGDRGEPAGFAVEREPFDLLETLQQAVAALPAAVPAPVLDLPEALPAARGDRASIATVVAELCTNAVKYSPRGSSVELHAAADRSSVFFQVADRGIGVRPEDVEKVFVRFWQAEQGDQRRFGGVGLGLYIVRRLLDRQGGWVAVRPRDGGGTVVEVRLPRADAAAITGRGPQGRQ